MRQLHPLEGVDALAGRCRRQSQLVHAFQEEYLRKLFGFLGVTDIEIVRAEGVNLSPENKQRAIASALEAIRADESLAA